MERFWGIVLILISAASFGAMPVFAHFAYQEGVSVNSLLFFRFFIAFLMMLPIALVKKLEFPRGQDLLILITMGLVGYAGVSYCFFNALTLIPAATVSTLLYLYPIIVATLSVWILKTPLTRIKILALFLALGGIVLVVGVEAGTNLKGISLGICAPLFYSVYIITGARVMKRNDVFFSSIVIIGAAAAFYFFCSLKTGFFLPSGVEGSLSILSIALVSTVLAIYTFFMGVNYAGPVNASMLSTFEPVTTVFIFYLAFGQPIGPSQTAGTILILVSAVMVALGGKYDGNLAKE